MSCIIRRSFPQVYELEHPKNGTYWLVSARRKKFGLNERKTFSTKARALEHAVEIEHNFLKFGAQTDVPKEKVVMADRFQDLTEQLAHFGKGRLAEDGLISSRYNLTESSGKDYLQRTEWNARDSDGTVVFTIAPILSGGSKRTVQFAEKHKKTVVHISSATEQPAEKLVDFIRSNGIRILNVAGSRGSKEPEIGEFVKRVLGEANLLACLSKAATD